MVAIAAALRANGGGQVGVRSDNRGRFTIGSNHPSQQSTFTGRLTAGMSRSVFETARGLAGMDCAGKPARDGIA